jgi:hypothetical protein
MNRNVYINQTYIKNIFYTNKIFLNFCFNVCLNSDLMFDLNII